MFRKQGYWTVNIIGDGMEWKSSLSQADSTKRIIGRIKPGFEPGDQSNLKSVPSRNDTTTYGHDAHKSLGLGKFAMEIERELKGTPRHLIPT
jgi:hypothetical protein